MEMGKNASLRVAGLLRDRTGPRPSAMLRRGRRRLRPMAEDLEGRTLLSVGLDPTYGFGGVAQLNVPANTATNAYEQSISSIALQSGKVVAVGDTSTGGFSSSSVNVWRLNTNGTLDTSFGSSGMQTIPTSSGGVTYVFSGAPDIAVQSGGSIDVLAYVIPTSSPGAEEFLVAQLTANGALDTSFGTSGTELVSFGANFGVEEGNPASLALGPDGKIVVAATLNSTASSSKVFGIARLNTNGTLDTTFNTTGIVTLAPFNAPATPATDDIANAVVVQPDSKIVVVGQADLPEVASGMPTDIAVVRLNANGTLDTSFNSTGLLTFSYNFGGDSADSGNAVALAGTQIVIAGTSAQLFTPPSNGDVQAATVTRLNTNGTFDTSFNGSGKFILSFSQAGITFNSQATAITTLSNGSLLVGGSAFEQNVFTNNVFGMLAQLTSAGTLDPTYGTGGVAVLPQIVDSQVFVQTDGKVLYNGNLGITRTTAPAPLVASTTIITQGTGKNAKATGVTISFNTAINPALVKNVKIFVLRAAKGGKLIKIKRISLDSTGQNLTFNFAKTAVGKGFKLVITPGAIVGADGSVFGGGAPVTIVIPPNTM
jgi:uncharacterized delta-60 repeat protein